MFYRVDYILAVLFAGFLVGVLLRKAAANLTASRLARGYYVTVVALLVLRTGTFTATMLVSHPTLWSTASGFLGDVLGFLFGVLFGLAFRRVDARELLTSKAILNAFCVTLAFTFALAGLGKAFSIAPMTEFFTQSGYSVGFLKLIVIAEVFGAIGLLLPWALLPALIGLTVDMFGAVLTHIHNGDPLNDSTGAIGMLIRLGAIGILLAMRTRDGEARIPVRSAVLRTAAPAVTCLLIAFGGSTAIRHLGTSPAGVVSRTAK